MTGESLCVWSIKQNMNQMKFLLYSDWFTKAKKYILVLETVRYHFNTSVLC